MEHSNFSKIFGFGQRYLSPKSGTSSQIVFGLNLPRPANLGFRRQLGQRAARSRFSREQPYEDQCCSGARPLRYPHCFPHEIRTTGMLFVQARTSSTVSVKTPSKPNFDLQGLQAFSSLVLQASGFKHVHFLTCSVPSGLDI